MIVATRTDFNQMSRRDLQHDVQELIARHAELIDDDRLEEWPELFVADCVYKVIPRENEDRGMPLAVIHCDSRNMLIDRVVSLRKANIYPTHFYRHVLSTARITAVEPDVIRAQTNYVVFQTRNDGHTEIYNAGKYVDEIVASDDGLRFRSKKAVFDTNRVDTLMVRPV